MVKDYSQKVFGSGEAKLLFAIGESGFRISIRFPHPLVFRKQTFMKP